MHSMHLKKADKIIYKHSARVHCSQDFIVKKVLRFKNLAES